MAKIEFVKINGHDVAFIDERVSDLGYISASTPPIVSLRCGSEVLENQLVSSNERGEIVPANGQNICGIVVKVEGDYAAVKINYDM